MLRSVSTHRLSYSLPNYIIGKASSIKFGRASSSSNSDNKPQTSNETDQDKDAKSGTNKPLDGGYAKRSDEQGFGATYGGNQSLSKDDEDKIVHGNVPGIYFSTYMEV
ncbi:uncharacterized protein LOC125202330 isoform X2 [Salvia hispanica]|uniref:uncharacterized protein LOC125202330 isoform X2 n=1 Tax=Salvia hispanica TaxID=49212 RepID=UPI002009D0D4|nr:uncharacterized protein LOC125202330 isoform X2 [Salvia hispanica]